MIMDGVKVKVVSSHITPSKGSAGLRTQRPRRNGISKQPRDATGGIGPGNLAQRDTK